MDVIIIGAGAAGLMAAMELSQAGLSVCVLEARERLGGRIHTIGQDGYGAIEGGAEFIHGNLEVTLRLLQEAGIAKQELSGEVWQVNKGHWKKQNDFFENTAEVIEKLQQVRGDISIGEFIQTHFGGAEHERLREGLVSYVEGYYSGEISKMSAKSFLIQWLSEDNQQYRPKGGYMQLIHYLHQAAKKLGAVFHLSTVVKRIKWSKGMVEVIDAAHQSYEATKVVITVPTGVWTAEPNGKGAIEYFPEIPQKIMAAKQMGFGYVIKVALKFKEPFWEDGAVKKKCQADTADFHMAISEQVFPTWWSQLPDRSTLLTGWLSGPLACKMKNDDEKSIFNSALQSLSNIFNIDLIVLEKMLHWWKVFNWSKDPYTRGSYSYSTLFTTAAREVMSQPIEGTLFFAGEALYNGPEMGTVEAALISGIQVAKDMKKD